MQSKIQRLTPAQIALIPEYLEKWRKIALSTEPIDRQQATQAIKAAYAAIAKPEPQVFFCDSPNAVPNTFTLLLKRRFGREMEWLVDSYSDEQRAEQLKQELGIPLEHYLRDQLYKPFMKQIKDQLHWQVWLELEGQTQERLYEQYEQQLWAQLQFLQPLRGYLHHSLNLENKMQRGFLFDFAISVLNCAHDSNKWLALRLIDEHCGWLFPYEKICIACDRPRHLSFDAQNRLHAEGEAAIQFADGFSVYAYQGVRLPEQYGRLHPQQWRSHWLLSESNAELRQVLIQAIGYGRICQELEAIELDSWREYTLLEIAASLEEEAILLLKMTCPSTGLIHVARVPPEVDSAKEAIRWVNWDIDPEEFAIQT